MMGLVELNRLNELAALRLTEAKNPPLPTPAAPSGDIILVVYDTSHNRTSRAYMGRSGPFVHDPAMAKGWTEDEMDEVWAAKGRLQSFVGLNCEVAVDRKPVARQG